MTMYRLISVLALSLLLIPYAAAADSYRLAEDIVLEVDLPSERWVVSREPSEGLVEDVTEHMHHDLEEQGRDVPEDQVRQVALQRLAANELFIRSTSGAHMEIDVSPLEPGDNAPSAKGVRTSAVYAGQSMEGEEGVSEATPRVSDFNMPGSSVAYRLDVDYVQHKKRMNFVGIIGFEDPYWLYFYATDPLLDKRDAEEMEKIVESLRIVRDSGDQ